MQTQFEIIKNNIHESLIFNLFKMPFLMKQIPKIILPAINILGQADFFSSQI